MLTRPVCVKADNLEAFLRSLLDTFGTSVTVKAYADAFVPPYPAQMYKPYRDSQTYNPGYKYEVTCQHTGDEDGRNS